MTSVRTLEMPVEVLLELSYPGVPLNGFYSLSPELLEFQKNLCKVTNHKNLFS